MAEPLVPQQRNSLDDILNKAFDDLERERQRRDNIINAPDPAKRLGEIQRVEKQVSTETPDIQQAVTTKMYQDTSYYTGRPLGSPRPVEQDQPLVKPGLKPGEVDQWWGVWNAMKSGYKQGQLARNIIALEGGADAEERLKEIASIQAELRGIPRSRAYNEFNQAKTFGETFKRLALDPIEITSQLVVESMASFLPTQLAGMMTGAGVGAGIGTIVPGAGTIAGASAGALYGGITSAGLTGLALEYSGKMLEVMGEMGVDVENPDDLARGFSDQKIMSEARKLGLRKGIPIALFDAVSAGVAGRFMKPGRSLASKAIQGSKEVGTQAVLGSSGELAGQLSAGEEIQPSAIVAEGIAEIGQSAPTGAVRVATQNFKTQKLEQAKAKGLEALNNNQLRTLSDKELQDFTRSLTKEEAMEVGIDQEKGTAETTSAIGQEFTRRELNLDKIPETERELREVASKRIISDQKAEGKDFVGRLIEKAQEESGIQIEREYLDRTLADEIQDENLSEERSAEILKEHGIDENTDPNKIMITGRTSGYVVRLSTAGTEERLADEFVAVNEEMAEVYYNAETEKGGQDFENEVSQDRKNYYEATGESDTGESNKEWFSTMALRFATQGQVHESIGAKLRDIFKEFIASAQKILADSLRLKKHIEQGKISDSLLNKLESATDFKKVGESVRQAKESKKQPSYRTVRKPKGKDVLGRDIPDWRGATVFHSTNEKSAEDIKQKGYRTDIEDQSGYYGKAISFTPDIEYTKQFGDIVTTAKISEDAKILNQNDPEDSEVFDSIMEGKGWGPDMHQYFLDAGIDGVYDPGAGDLFIYNPKVVTYKSSKSATSYRLTTQDYDYRGVHTAPSADYGSPGHDLTEMYPDDIYGPNGARYYGHGGSSRNRRQDEITISKIRSMQGNPDKMIKIYRAVPKGVKEINPGDWVSINRDYAKEHGERYLDKFKILIKKVPAKEIFTDGNSIHEWGWIPQEQIIPTSTPQFKKWFGDSKVVDNNGKPLVVYHGTGKSFDVFDKSKLYGDGISGFYFTSDPKLASDYAEMSLKEDSEIIRTPAGGGRMLGGNVMPVYLQMNKPYYVNYKKDLIGPTPEKIRKWKSEGYDGIIDEENKIYQVFEPTQIKSIFNKGEFSQEDPRISYRMSIAEGMEKLRTKPALRAPSDSVKLSKGQKKTRIKRALNNTIKDIKKLEKDDPKAFTEAIGWYADDILKTIDILSNETQFAKDHPVLFTTILAITSNGQKVPANYNNTADLSVEFDKSGKLPVADDVTTESGKPKKVLKIGDRVLGGVRNDTIGKHGDRLQFLIDKFGIEGAETWLTSEWTGREILQILKESGTGKTVSGLKVTPTYRGMRIFGRKIGNFGLSFHDLTDEAVIDVWMTRWWNRQMGTPYLKDKSVAESPRNPQEFDLIVDAVQAITDEINKGSDIELSVASVQALIWYNEKNLYEKNNINVEKAVNYSEVANARNTTTKKSKTQPSEQDAELKGSEEGAPGVSQKVQKSDQKTSYRLAPTFYSQAEKSVTEKFPPSMKAQSVPNWLQKNQVTPEEIYWLDLESLLKGKQKVTKEELQEYIQANKIEVQDVMKGVSFTMDEEKSLSKSEFIKMFEEVDPAYPDEPAENNLDDGETLEFVEDGTYYDFKYYKNDDKEYVTYKDKYEDDTITVQRVETDEYMGFKSPEAIVERGVKNDEKVKQVIGSISDDATRHSPYQLPGEKEDYRELLLTLPVDYKEQVGIFENGKFTGIVFDTPEEAHKFKKENQTVGLVTSGGFAITDRFTSGHFDEPNILAHVRFNTRKSPTGEKVLFIEEVQSDWHKQGREKGYKKKIPANVQREINSLNKKRYSLTSKIFDLRDQEPGGGMLFEPGTRKVTKSPDNIKNRLSELQNELKLTNDKRIELEEPYSPQGVTNAPFKDSGWIKLIMKRMLRHASENNFDRIAWTTSSQQVERWRSELRQNVDQISWQKNIPRIQSFEEFYKDDQEFMRGLGREISRVNYDQYVKEESEAIQGIVPSVIINGLKNNKSVFNQTVPIEGETTINGQKVTLDGLLGKQMATQIRKSQDKTGVIEGDNLTIGGTGFKVVYDFAIKKILNKMGKPSGVKVDQVELPLKSKGTGEYVYDEIADVEREVLNYQLATQPSIRVSRKMKESALKGQPTFRASKRTTTEDVLDSPSFKKWFKGSQVKDKNGKPLVVYHGTKSNIDEFNIDTAKKTQPGNRMFGDGFYFSRYLTTPNRFSEGPGGNIIPVYLSIKNPWIANQESPKWKPETIEKFLDAVGRDESADYIEEKLNGFNKGRESVIQQFLGSDGFQKILIENGYDGIKDGPDYIAFKPTQIKSIFNKGTFNPHDPKISFHIAEKDLVTPLAKIYQQQKGNKKRYTKKNFEDDLIRLGYQDDEIRTAMDLFGIIRIKQIETTDPTPIEKELKKIQKRHTTRSELKTRIKRAYRIGAQEKEKEILKLQKMVTRYARDNMPVGEYKKSEVTGLLAKVRDAKRYREMISAFERIDRVIDKVEKRSALSSWNKVIKKKAKVKKVKGIPQGQVGSEVQDIVNKIRAIYKLDQATVEDKRNALLDSISKNEDGEPTEEQTINLNINMMYGAIRDKTPQEITEATNFFNELVDEGRMMVIQDQEAYKERMAEVKAEILDIITGGAGTQSQSGAQRIGLKKEGKVADIKELISSIDSSNQSLEYLFDKLSRLDKTSKPLESYINEYFMPKVRQARIAEYNGLVEMQKMLMEKAEEIFGVKGRKLTQRLNQNTVDKIRVDHKDGAEGSSTYSELTYNQAYKKWMELQDPTLHKTFESMGWNIFKTQRQIEGQLPADVLKWAKWQLNEFYPMYYQRVNETFRKRFNINMPFNPVYSPISRRVGSRADEGDDTLNKSKSPMGSMTSMGSLKARVSNTEELTWIDGDTTIMRHITEMEHFVHYTQVMRELRSVFMSRDISKAIIDYHGQGMSRVLNKFMDDIARGGVDQSNNIYWMDWLRGNFSRSAIGANPVVFLKQLASIPAYMADIPMLSWSKEFAKLFNPIEFRRMYKTLSKSEMLKMRYDKGFERDMVEALKNTKPGKVITGANLFNNLAYALTKMGDKQAIFLGGWAVYKYHYKQALKDGKTRQEAKNFAMKKFEEATLRSQQASDVEDVSDFARRGSLAKLFTMFMTSPNQYYRMVIGGYRNLFAGRGSKSENVRKIVVGQFLLPTLFEFISNGFEWDNEDQAMSILLFPFSGLLFFGQGFDYMVRSIYGKAFPMGTVPVLSFMEDYGKALKRAFNDKKFTTEKTLKIADDFISGTSKVLGVPYAPAIRTGKGIVKVAKGEAEKPIREAIGFRFDKGKKKKKKKKIQYKTSKGKLITTRQGSEPNFAQ